MSRGLGRVQRGVLDCLGELGASIVHELAMRLYGTPVAAGDARYEAVRRAVRALERRGLVRQCEGKRERVRVHWTDGTHGWINQFELVSVGKASGESFPTLNDGEHEACTSPTLTAEAA